MKNLNPYSCNHIEKLQEVINSKRSNIKAILASISVTLCTKYEEYEENINSLELLTNNTWSDEEKNALLACYSSETNVLKKIKKSILENNPNMCQYCGINTVKPFDHYLPKEIFPEYAVLVLNLIPCCSDCNNLKGKIWLSQSGNRQFINYYFDPIDNMSQYLTCKITSNPDNTFSAEFNLDFGNSFPKQIEEVINNHYKQLKLVERYKKNINEEISSIEISIVDSYKRLNLNKNDLIERITTFLKDNIESRRLLYGTNSWKAALVQGLSESSEFVEFCVNRTLEVKA